MEDNSVIFNLSEIMRLEKDRVTAEAAAVRAAEAHAIAEREARVRHERDRVARAQAEAVERERAAAEKLAEAARNEEAARAAVVLRLKLEAEANQRLALQAIELAHAEKLHEVTAAQRGKRASIAVAAALIAVCIAAGGAYAYVLEPALQAARERSAALDHLTTEAAAQNRSLSRQMQELLDQRKHEAASATALTPSESNAASGATSSTRTIKRAPTQKPAVTKPNPDALGDLCKGSDDPLCGLGGDSSPTRKRR